MNVKNRMGEHGLDSSGSEYGEVGDCCEHKNGPIEPIKCKEFLD